MSGLEIIQVLQNNLCTFLSPVQLVTGAIMSAIFLRKKNRIETETQEFEKIKAGHMKDAADMLLESGKLTYSEYFKMNNFLQIAEMADEEFKKNYTSEDIPNSSFDWFIRFYEDCGSVSDKDLQKIWARILANEVSEPGSYSLRTLEALKNLSKVEALLFQKICDNSLKSGKHVYLLNKDTFLNDSSITYDDIIELEDCGLMKSSTTITMDCKLDDKNGIGVIAVSNEWAILVRKRVANHMFPEVFHIPAYLFSSNGAELFSVIKNNQDGFLVYMKKVFSNLFPQYTFFLGKITGQDEDGIHYQYNGNNES